ncbi:hypothetical protein M569_12338 [Genlisea aurea]|uniref:Pentatricopeptide repeat-containing protein n=1 Tax=Genlisea aurea TaxID=192259 RepID=S8C6P3_9LAMI|nr:hypothetical protein M569_12338 [Genlisea aurea]
MKGTAPDVLTFDMLIEMYSLRGDLVTALNIMKWCFGVSPTEATFGSMFTGLREARTCGDFQGAWKMREGRDGVGSRGVNDSALVRGLACETGVEILGDLEKRGFLSRAFNGDW